MSNKNKWVCLTETFAAWSMEFPFPDKIDVPYLMKLLQFMKELLDLAEQYQLIQIEKSHLHTMNKGIPEIGYIDQMQWCIEHQQYLPFFGYLDSQAYGDETLTKTGLISYYDENNTIVSDKVSNMVKLLKSLRPERTDADYHIPPYTSPVDIKGTVIEIGRDYRSKKSVFVYTKVNTDIWFPKVLAPMDISDKFALWEDADLVDNSELAAIHTPRLNQFLLEARNLTLRFDGVWRGFGSSVSGLKKYHTMVIETGIRLDLENSE